MLNVTSVITMVVKTLVNLSTIPIVTHVPVGLVHVITIVTSVIITEEEVMEITSAAPLVIAVQALVTGSVTNVITTTLEVDLEIPMDLGMEMEYVPNMVL